MSKLTLLGITAAALIGTAHGLLVAMYQLAIDQDTTSHKTPRPTARRVGGQRS